MLLASYTQQSRITARLTKKLLVLCGEKKVSYILLWSTIHAHQRLSAADGDLRPCQKVAVHDSRSPAAVCSPVTSETLSTERKVATATMTDCLACRSIVLPQKRTQTALLALRVTCHSSIHCLCPPSKSAEKHATARPWLLCAELSKPLTSASTQTTRPAILSLTLPAHFTSRMSSVGCTRHHSIQPATDCLGRASRSYCGVVSTKKLARSSVKDGPRK